MLIEAGPRVLAGFPEDLSAYAQRSLEKLGVEVVLGQRGHRMLRRRRGVWRQEAAGQNRRSGPPACAPRPPREWLDAPADRAGRLKVEPDLTVPGHPDIFAIGDTVTIAGPDGKPVPGIAPAAKQQGRYVAASIKARLRGKRAGRRSATSIPATWRRSASSKAVIDFGRIKLRGALAWWIWGIAHIYFLIGLRNRLSVALSWLWIHARDQRAARLITQGSSKVVGPTPTTDPAYKISKTD